MNETQAHFHIRIIVRTFEEFRWRLDLRVMSPFNKWVAGEKAHHDPSYEECFEHFKKHGGMNGFLEDHDIRLLLRSRRMRRLIASYIEPYALAA